MDGIAGTADGSIIALMLDEVMGQLAAEIFARYIIVTASLDVAFKKWLDTLRVVLVRAYTEGGEEDVKRGNIRGEIRRKLKIIGRVEDGQGGIFAEGTSVFVELRPKL